MVDVGPSNEDMDGPFCGMKGVLGAFVMGSKAAMSLVLVMEFGLVVSFGREEALVVSKFLSLNRLARLFKARVIETPSPVGSSACSASTKVDPST